MGISEDTYIGLVLAFYSTLVPIDGDNTYLRSIIGNFEIQVLPSDIAQITNSRNDGILCRPGERWWENKKFLKKRLLMSSLAKGACI